MDWTKVAQEILPEEGRGVMVVCRMRDDRHHLIYNFIHDYAKFENGKWFIYDWDDMEDWDSVDSIDGLEITHWLYYPDLPLGVDDREEIE